MVYCRGCGKQIHETAPSCPQCGAVQYAENAPAKGSVIYTSYDQVPWFRRQLAIVLFVLFFSPALFYIFLTGEAYYQKDGELKTYSPTRKYILLLIPVIVILRIVMS